MLPNRLLVGAVWDGPDVDKFGLPNRVDVSFDWLNDWPNDEDITRERKTPY